MYSLCTYVHFYGMYKLRFQTFTGFINVYVSLNYFSCWMFTKVCLLWTINFIERKFDGKTNTKTYQIRWNYKEIYIRSKMIPHTHYVTYILVVWTWSFIFCVEEFHPISISSKFLLLSSEKVFSSIKSHDCQLFRFWHIDSNVGKICEYRKNKVDWFD